MAEAVRKYLKDTGNEGKSMCQVLQAENSPHVGTATVFVSHVQASHVASLLGTLNTSANLFPACSSETFYWVDLCSLQQCVKNAFVVEEIVSVIKMMDACLIEIDQPCAYLGRIFCIFEAFAAVLTGVYVCVAPLYL